jgi:DNA invertase Pin-like site-specific DNA recombinase
MGSAAASPPEKLPVKVRQATPTQLLAQRPGCGKVFLEHASGVLTRPPVFDETLRYLLDGDTLVVTKLDRLGRSVRNLKQIALTQHRERMSVPDDLVTAVRFGGVACRHS